MIKKIVKYLDIVIIFAYFLTMVMLTVKRVNEADELSLIKHFVSFAVVNCFYFGTIFVIAIIVLQIIKKRRVMFVVIISLITIVLNYYVVPLIINGTIEEPMLNKKLTEYRQIQ